MDTVTVEVKPGSEQWLSEEVAVQKEVHKLLDVLAHAQKCLCRAKLFIQIEGAL